MRLEKMKLSGFKSFVDPTTIEFPSNLVGVIGPNGCGKSNIIDAVRWVLGESSAKMLRGESMTDVIFNGSSQRKPVGLAQVELIFDNSDGTVGGEYAGFSQISIKREVNRDSQSSYFLNNTRCRRKDIFSAFYGTGLGARSYSVIEQGMISRFIEAKPEELRNYLEEVAGISKYKARRRETELRINHTRENLARLTDIREELEKQLKTLDRQAQAAERYKALKEEEHLLKGQLNVLQWREINGKLSTFETVLQERINKQEAKKADLQNVETHLEAARQKQIDTNDAFNHQQQQYYAIGSEVTRIEQAISHQKERQQQLVEDKSQIEADFNNTQEHLLADRDEAEALNVEIQQLEPALTASEEALQQSQSQLAAAEEAMQQWQQQWDGFNEKAAAVTQATNVEKTKIDHLQAKIQSLHDQSVRYHSQHEQIDLEALTQLLEAHKAELLTVTEEQQAAEQALNATQSGLEQQIAAESQLRQALDANYDRQREDASRYATLNALQQAALGQSNALVQQWLEGNALHDKPRLLNTLDVESGWEKAVETVLGNYLEAVCVEDVSQVVGKLADLHEGSLLLLDKSANALPDSRNADALIHKLKSSWPVADLIGDVKIANDLSQAMQMRQTLKSGESIITKDGIWLGKNWLRVARPDQAEGNTLERKNEIDRLEISLNKLSKTIENQKIELEDLKLKISNLNATKSEKQQRSMTLSVKQAELQSRLTADEQKRTADQQKLAELNEVMANTHQALEASEQALSIAQQAYEEAVFASKNDDSLRSALSSQRENLRQSLNASKDTLNLATQAYHENQVRLQTCKNQLETIQQNNERLESRLSDLSERQQQLELAITSNDNPDQNLEEALRDKLNLHVTAENALKVKRSELESINTTMSELEASRAALEQAIASTRDAVEQVKLDMQSLRVRSQTLEEQLQEMQLELKVLHEALEEDATISVWQESLSKVENRIVRLGAINLAAADEFKAQSERKEYLDAQDEDLTKALAILEEAIAKIDKETKTRFQETYDTVNGTFKELFPKVFGGGSAYLELQGDDLLTTGVTVFARPPGKKNSTIHLLSGGEKALTAVALVFAIFQLNPAPFCMLDEVDAPLDDVNLLRYCSLVKEMSEKVQFIFVTHNKIAMEMASQLMGVTMHEPGVSRLVTVDVEQAVELSEA